MHKFVIVVVSFFLVTPISAFAQNEVSENLFNQLKENVEQSCKNKDYINCIEATNAICAKISQEELEKISQIIDSQSQAIADGKISELLLEIKKARSEALNENGIDIEKANSCGKQFLIN